MPDRTLRRPRPGADHRCQNRTKCPVLQTKKDQVYPIGFSDGYGRPSPPAHASLSRIRALRGAKKTAVLESTLEGWPGVLPLPPRRAAAARARCGVGSVGVPAPGQARRSGPRRAPWPRRHSAPMGRPPGCQTAPPVGWCSCSGCGSSRFYLGQSPLIVIELGSGSGRKGILGWDSRRASLDASVGSRGKGREALLRYLEQQHDSIRQLFR
jgi:hypothetical protein